ncbi:hypothetical protein ACIRPX_38685 [Streptomyces sp. NPDC101225]|uniref:hypothetical protein n=1 Tax=Streptomyces sp. NPDC101225 TaxID=3366135 RepID=UPI003800D2B1
MLRGTSRTTWTRGRRGALIGASAAVVCLGAALAACGGGGPGEGYVATGAAGGAPRPSGTAAAPTGGVTLVPLDGSPRRSGSPAAAGSPSGLPDDPPAGAAPAAATATASTSAAGATPGGDAGGSRGGAKSASGSPASPSPAATPGAETPAGPADLAWSDPTRTATDRRWCEDVTLTFTNSGGTAVRSGTVTFGTHIIGALGIDWATRTSDVPLPAPIGAGADRKKTWTVCVDAWRVPLGMHIETRDVTVRWK